MYAIINARIYDYRQYIDHGFIIFNEKIIDIGIMSEYKKPKECLEIDAYNKIVIPGIISGHTHLYSTFARGASLNFNPQNFLEILKQMWWKIDHFLDLDMVYYSALMGGIDQLKHGTTSLIDHHASGKVLGSLEKIKKALVDDLGLRAVLAFETSDRFNIKEAIQENMNFIKDNKTQEISGLFGMHASLSLANDSLEEIKNNLSGQGIHIHVAESLMDEEECINNYQMRVVERLDHYGLINESSLLVHCTHINEEEMDIIKKRKATIAVNPTSNLNNAVGISHVKKFLDKGIRVIVGNDGLISSQPMEYLNTYYLAHLKNESPMAFGLDDVKQLMINTYDYLNECLNTQLGKFVVGAQADLLVLPYIPYTDINESNVFGHLFFGVFPGFLPEKVFVKGKNIINNYQLSTDYKKSYKEAYIQAQKLWKILEKEGNDLEFKN